MKVLSVYINLEKLQAGYATYADVEIDMEREDKKINIFRFDISPSVIYDTINGNSSYSSRMRDYSKLTKRDCFPLIKEKIGQVVSDRLMEDIEKLENL